MNWKHAITHGIALASLAALAVGPVLAQQHDHGQHGSMDPEDRLEARLGFLDERLDLDDEQADSVRAILEEAQKEGMAWKDKNAGASRDDRRSFFMEHRASTNAAISEVLNDSQKTKFEELKDLRGPRGEGMKGRKGRKGMGAGHGKGAGHGVGLRGLDLTDEQKEAFREILTDEQRAKYDRMLADSSRQGYRGRDGHGGPGMLLNQLDLTEEQQAKIDEFHENHRAAAKAWHDANPNATKEERRAFRDAHHAGMKAMLGTVLTEEQVVKLDSLKTNHPKGHRGGIHGRK
ncbi:MAG TPA: Spy/CpxP family protein refolding chaperone [Rhodothermales bacterium]|nr:Spy/CpxP family protein refolding chaperone [Rhodothermales bacterium]